MQRLLKVKQLRKRSELERRKKPPRRKTSSTKLLKKLEKMLMRPRES